LREWVALEHTTSLLDASIELSLRALFTSGRLVGALSCCFGDLARLPLASEDLTTHLVTMFDERVLQVDGLSENLVSMDDRYVSAGREG
jgi:hypothetical protein